MRLTIGSGSSEGRTVEVTGEQLVIGRDPDCELILDDSKVSRQHASLKPLPDGRAELRDLGTTNGTYVDGKRIEGPIVLQGGEEVRVGRTVLKADPGAPVAAPGGDDATRLATPRPPPAPPPEPKAAPPPLEREAPEREPAAAPPAQPTALPASGSVAERGRSVVGRSRSVVAERSRSVVERIQLRRAVRRATILATSAVVVAVVVVLLFVTGVVGGGGEEEGLSSDEIVDAVADSTVLVVASKGGERAGNGTGWVLDAGEGLIVTNAHVVNAGTRFEVGVGEDRRPAEIVGNAPCEDLAVLRTKDTSGLKTLPLGSQSAVKLGETVVAVGFPGTVSEKDSLTATSGVVSRVRTTYDFRAPDVPQYRNVVQTDTAINPGNSGGPLVDFDVRLVGVNSAGGLPETQNQNYAIGVDRVREVTADLRRGRSIGWTGMGFQFLDPQKLARDGLPPGIAVGHVVPGTPADRAALGRESLLISTVNGRKLDTTLPSYCEAVRGVRSGESATFRLVDGAGRARELDIAFK
jgi:S1-C subfamily serine protease